MSFWNPIPASYFNKSGTYGAGGLPNTDSLPPVGTSYQDYVTWWDRLPANSRLRAMADRYHPSRYYDIYGGKPPGQSGGSERKPIGGGGGGGAKEENEWDWNTKYPTFEGTNSFVPPDSTQDNQYASQGNQGYQVEQPDYQPNYLDPTQVAKPTFKFSPQMQAKAPIVNSLMRRYKKDFWGF